MTIEDQIREQMTNAFFNIIDESVNSDKPDYKWISELYIEIRDRLLGLVKKDGKIYKQINEDFDFELFQQMIENNIFNYECMIKLVNNVFDWIEKLQAPMRDSATREIRNTIFKTEPHKMISYFIKESHLCIDNIYKDLENLN